MNPVRNFWYVYILESTKDRFWYTGCTNNFNKRLRKHNDGKVYATKSRRPLVFIYCEISRNKFDAFRREKYLKSGMGKRYIKNRLKYYFSGKEG
jgi:putative endonuclease